MGIGLLLSQQLNLDLEHLAQTSYLSTFGVPNTSSSRCRSASSTIGPRTAKPSARPFPRMTNSLSPRLIPYASSVSDGTLKRPQRNSTQH